MVVTGIDQQFDPVVVEDVRAVEPRGRLAHLRRIGFVAHEGHVEIPVVVQETHLGAARCRLALLHVVGDRKVGQHVGRGPHGIVHLAVDHGRTLHGIAVHRPDRECLGCGIHELQVLHLRP